jgi:hypothetical protein
MTLKGNLAQAYDAAGPTPPGAEDEALVILPKIKVRTDGAAIAAFQRAVGVEPIAGAAPLTFPFCWLTLPAVRPMIAQMIGDGVLPLHEAQSFEYERGLDVDADYIFTVELLRTENPPRLILRGRIAGSSGEAYGRLETVLRLARVGSEPAP